MPTRERYFGGRNEAGENEMAFEAERFCEIFKSSAPFAIADKQKFDLRAAADEFGRDGEQIVVALEFEQPRDFADDEIAGLQTKLRAEGGVVFRREKRFERKAAENFRVLLRPADAGGEVLGFHGIGDDDEMCRGAGGILFRRRGKRNWQARFENFRMTGRGWCG